MTTSRIGNLTRLILTLAICYDHTYIPYMSEHMRVPDHRGLLAAAFAYDIIFKVLPRICVLKKYRKSRETGLVSFRIRTGTSTNLTSTIKEMTTHTHTHCEMFPSKRSDMFSPCLGCWGMLRRLVLYPIHSTVGEKSFRPCSECSHLKIPPLIG